MLWMKKTRWFWLQWSVVDYGFKPGRELGLVLLPRDGTGSEPYHALFSLRIQIAKRPRLFWRAAF